MKISKTGGSGLKGMERKIILSTDDGDIRATIDSGPVSLTQRVLTRIAEKARALDDVEYEFDEDREDAEAELEKGFILDLAKHLDRAIISWEAVAEDEELTDEDGNEIDPTFETFSTFDYDTLFMWTQALVAGAVSTKKGKKTSRR